jgi:hypothetical protein
VREIARTSAPHPVFDDEIATLYVAVFPQPLAKGIGPAWIAGHVERQKAYSRNLARLLGLGGERCR